MRSFPGHFCCLEEYDTGTRKQQATDWFVAYINLN